MNEMHELICDSFTEQIYERYEVGSAMNDRYFSIISFEEDNNPTFVETWKTDTGSFINVMYDNCCRAMKQRETAEEKLGMKLITLIRVRVPYYFFKDFYL